MAGNSYSHGNEHTACSAVRQRKQMNRFREETIEDYSKQGNFHRSTGLFSSVFLLSVDDRLEVFFMKVTEFFFRISTCRILFVTLINTLLIAT
jgi:hypothetical protein